MEEKISEVIKLLNRNNELLENIFKLFLKYDNSYSEEIIKENNFNIS